MNNKYYTIFIIVWLALMVWAFLVERKKADTSRETLEALQRIEFNLRRP